MLVERGAQRQDRRIELTNRIGPVGRARLAQEFDLGHQRRNVRINCGEAVIDGSVDAGVDTLVQGTDVSRNPVDRGLQGRQDSRLPALLGLDRRSVAEPRSEERRAGKEWKAPSW